MSSKKPGDTDRQFFFRLFNNLKDESEVELARRELQSLFGEVKEVLNFVDAFVSGDLPEAVLVSPERTLRLQDAVTYELPYGGVQGFRGIGKVTLVAKLARRLAYTREVYVVVPRAFKPALETLNIGVNLFVYESRNSKILRVVTNQYFLEKSHYISKLSRNKQEIDANLDTLLNYLRVQSNRIPATETMAVGRRLEDWFAIREEPSLYLTHYMHPYKGKFHPKMARALINYTFPSDKGLVFDNFSGSGTTLVESQWLGLDSIGADINPLSSLMSQVKVQCLELDSKKLATEIESFISKLSEQIVAIRAGETGQQTLSGTEITDASKFSKIISELPSRVTREVATNQIQEVLLAKSILDSEYGKLDGNKVHEFLLLGISGAISDVSRRTTQDFLAVLIGRLWNLWGRVYLSEKLAEFLHVDLGKGSGLVGDTRDLASATSIGGNAAMIADDSIDCIVNSPPYSTALDYIRNDLPQLAILQFAEDMDSLERNLIGNPNLKVYDEELQIAIDTNQDSFRELPQAGKVMLERMLDAGRGQDAGRAFKFWLDMRETLREMCRVLKVGGRAAVVIGDNNIQLERGTKKYEQVPNVAVLQELGKEVGLSVVEVIQRQIEKSMTGMIRNESIIIYEK